MSKLPKMVLKGTKGRVINLVFGAFSAYFLYLCTNSNDFWHIYSMYKIKKIPQTTFFDFAVLRFSAVFRRFLPTQWVSKDCPFSLHDTETF